MLKFAGLIVNKGVDAAQVGLVFVSIVPTFLEIAIPLATLLGVLLAFARLSGDSEIVVIRASGVSLFELLKPVLIAGALIFCCSLVVSNSLKPWGYKQLSNTLFEIARSKSTAGLDQGVFNKLGRITLYSEEINDQNGKLGHVMIDDRRTDSRKIAVSKKGQIVSDPEKQQIIFYLEDGYIHEIIEGKYVITKFNSNSIVLDTDEIYDPGVAQKGRSPKDMNTKELRDAQSEFKGVYKKLSGGENVDFNSISDLAKSLIVTEEFNQKEVGRRIRKLQIERSLRLSMPFAAFFLALVAMPLGIQPPRVQRTWGAGLSSIIGIFVFVLYYALLSIGLTMAEAGKVHPYIAVWTPNLLAFLIGSLMIYRIGKEQWQSVVEGLEFFLGRAQIRAKYVVRKVWGKS